MTVRFYVLPLIRTPVRIPKYFADPKFGIPGINVSYSLQDYGEIDMCIVCTNVTNQQHNTLISNSDVLAIPINIDQNLTPNAVTTAVNFLETYNIPAGWINTTQAYRYVLRIVTCMFMYMQKVKDILGHTITMPNGWASLTMAQVPTDIRSAMASAADAQNYDYSWVTGSTTVRQILKQMADNWSDTPIPFGMAVL